MARGWPRIRLLSGAGVGEIPDVHRWDAPPKVRFARDSPLEGDGFELPVPRELISAGGRNPAASGSTSALDGATRAQLGGAERTVARKWRKTGIFPPFRDAPRVKSVVWRNQVSSKINGLV